MGELHLGLEVADGPQPADDRRRAMGPAEVDGEALERGHLDAVERRVDLGERLADDADPLIGRQEGRLARVGQDADDDPLSRCVARSMMSRWPFVIGSNEPG